MPPSVPAALIRRRGVEGLSPAQLSHLLDNREALETLMRDLQTMHETLKAETTLANEARRDAEARTTAAEEAEAQLAGKRDEDEAALEIERAALAEREEALAGESEGLTQARADHQRAVDQWAGEKAREMEALKSAEAANTEESKRLAALAETLDETRARIDADRAALVRDSQRLDRRGARIDRAVTDFQEALAAGDEE